MNRALLRAALTLVVGLGALGGVAGCKSKPKAGDSCSAGQAMCLDHAGMMACVNGAFAQVPCRGAKGCAAAGSTITCDNDLANLGDTCDEVGDYACQTDHKAALECSKDYKFVVAETCKGARGCDTKADKLFCDNDISDPGDPCHTIGDFSCSVDKSMALKCENHAMVPLNSCRGAKACRVFELPEEKKIEFVCDDSIAQEADPCDEVGEEACTQDRKGLLKCVASKFTAFKTCAGPGGCSFDAKGERYACDQGAVAAAGKADAAAKGAKKGAAPPKKK